MLAAHAQYAKNLVQLRTMLEQAKAAAPKKVRGYTVEQLTANVAKFEALVAMDDDALRAHLSGIGDRIRAAWAR